MLVEFVENQMCPRRAEGVYPGAPVADEWIRNRWQDENAQWPEAFKTPRVCSWCGSAHPEDVIRLIEQGWEIEPTRKPYKWYIKPPGTMIHSQRVIKAIGNDNKLDKAFKAKVWKAMPAVKFYGMHGTGEQLEKLNSLLDRQRLTAKVD